MSTTERMRVALVGHGRWGQVLAGSLERSGLFHLASICDPEAAALEEAARRYPWARRAATLDGLLRSPACDELDAVVIATPTPTHAACARLALGAGKHVFVEKPLALSTEDAAQVVALARRTRRTLFVGHITVHHPGVRALGALLREGHLGQPRYLEALRSGAPRPGSAVAAGGVADEVLWALGPHDVAVAMHLLGEHPVRVSARGVTVDAERGAALVTATLRFGSGALMSLTLARLPHARDRRFTLVGTRGVAQLDEAAVPTLRAGRHGEPLVPVPVAPAEPLLGELRHFAAAVRGPGRVAAQGARGWDLCAGEAGAAVVQVLEACARSLRRDGSDEATGLGEAPWEAR